MKILFMYNDVVVGKPVSSRIYSFKKYFTSISFNEENFDKLSLKRTVFRYVPGFKRGANKHIFISMPPFRSFWLFFIPGLKIILDIRDGWSIAQESGYGGNVKKKPFKAKVSRLIERFAIRRSYLAITCTPGLKKYLSEISGREVLLIPNGISDEDLDLINELKKQQLEKKLQMSWFFVVLVSSQSTVEKKLNYY